MAQSPSGKAWVCNTLIHRFKSGLRLLESLEMIVSGLFSLCENKYLDTTKSPMRSSKDSVFPWGILRAIL